MPGATLGSSSRRGTTWSGPTSMPDNRKGLWLSSARASSSSAKSTTESCFVVEAGDASGTLGQARAALQQGRPLLVLDSSFRDPGLTWPHRYERWGALRVRDLADLRRAPPAPRRARGPRLYTRGPRRARARRQRREGRKPWSAVAPQGSIAGGRGAAQFFAATLSAMVPVRGTCRTTSRNFTMPEPKVATSRPFEIRRTGSIAIETL